MPPEAVPGDPEGIPAIPSPRRPPEGCSATERGFPLGIRSVFPAPSRQYPGPGNEVR